MGEAKESGVMGCLCLGSGRLASASRVFLCQCTQNAFLAVLASCVWAHIVVLALTMYLIMAGYHSGQVCPERTFLCCI